MSDAFSLAWAFLKQDEEEEEEEKTQQMSLLDFNKPPQPTQGVVQPAQKPQKQQINIPTAFGGQAAENLFDADGNLIMPEPKAAAPETVRPVAVTRPTIGPVVGVSPKKESKVAPEKIPWTDPRTGETRMVERVQNIKPADRAPKFVPVKRGTKDDSGNWRTKKVEPKESEFARAKRLEAEQGLSEAEKERRTKIVEGNIKDLTENRIIEMGGSTGETSPVEVGVKHHWLSPKPCELCNSTFKDYTKGKQPNCKPCTAAAKKGDKALKQRLEKLRKNPGHPINVKKE